MTKTTTKPETAEVREALADMCLSARCAAGVDEGASDDVASSEIMSCMGSAMAVSYDRAIEALASQPTPSAVGEADELRHALDRDRYVAAIVLNNLRQVLRSYDWLRGPSRGSYEYDDQRYQHEFGDALNMFEAALGPLVKMAGDKSLCTTDPDKVAAARVAGRERAAALAAPAPQPLDATLREKVARIIDPAAWAANEYATHVLGERRAASLKSANTILNALAQLPVGEAWLNLADIIETELNGWKGANGGIYTIHACALGVSIAVRSALLKSASLAQPQAIDAGEDARLGRFGHHPDAAIDFCHEVECCENDAYDLRARPRGRNDLIQRIGRAMSFRVGGDAGCVNAKHALRQLEQAVKDGTEREYMDALIKARATPADALSDGGGE